MHVTGIEVVGPAQTPADSGGAEGEGGPPGRRAPAPPPGARPAPSRAAAQPHPAPPADAGHAALLRRSRFPGDRDADPHQAHARGRARLPGAQSGAPGRVLRAARSRPSSTSSCSWWRGSIATSRSRAASGTRTCVPTGSRSSPRSTSRRRSSGSRTCSASARGWSRPCGPRPGQTVELPIRAAALRARRWSGTEATSPTCGYGLEIFDATEVFRPARLRDHPHGHRRRRPGARDPGAGRRVAHPQAGGRDRGRREDAGRGGCASAEARRAARSKEVRPSTSVADAAEALGLAEGDLCLLVAGPDHVTSPALDRVRQEWRSRLNLVPDGREPLRRGSWISRSSSGSRDRRAGVGQPSVHRAPPRRSAICSIRLPSGRGRWRTTGAQRHRAGRRKPSHRRSRLAAPDLRAARHHRGGGGAAVRLPAGGAARRRAAARRVRLRPGPHRDAAGRTRTRCATSSRFPRPPRSARCSRVRRPGGSGGSRELHLEAEEAK